MKCMCGAADIDSERKTEGERGKRGQERQREKTRENKQGKEKPDASEANKSLHQHNVQMLICCSLHSTEMLVEAAAANDA